MQHCNCGHALSHCALRFSPVFFFFPVSPLQLLTCVNAAVFEFVKARHLFNVPTLMHADDDSAPLDAEAREAFHGLDGSSSKRQNLVNFVLVGFE